MVNAQLKKIQSYPFIKPHDPSAIIKFSHIVSGCFNLLTQFGYESDLTSESVLNSAVRNLPNDLKAKWLTYRQRYDPSFKTMRVFSAWMKNIAELRDNLKMQFQWPRKRAISALMSRKQLPSHLIFQRRIMSSTPNVLRRIETTNFGTVPDDSRER